MIITFTSITRFIHSRNFIIPFKSNFYLGMNLILFLGVVVLGCSYGFDSSNQSHQLVLNFDVEGALRILISLLLINNVFDCGALKLHLLSDILSLGQIFIIFRMQHRGFIKVNILTQNDFLLDRDQTHNPLTPSS